MKLMGRPSSYPKELRERAVRMVLESKAEYATEFAAITSIARKLGIGSPETLRKWVRRAEVDAGQRPGVTSQESPSALIVNSMRCGCSAVEAMVNGCSSKTTATFRS